MINDGNNRSFCLKMQFFCSQILLFGFRYAILYKNELEIFMNNRPSESELNFVRDALKRYNDAQVGDDGHTPLHFVEYDHDGNLIGGIIGGTYWGWLYIDILWVDERYRRLGIGSKLLAAAENEAKRRRCHHVHVDTMSWQAPLFYKKHGYEIIGILPDIPTGHQKYLLCKSLL